MKKHTVVRIQNNIHTKAKKYCEQRGVKIGFFVGDIIDKKINGQLLDLTELHDHQVKVIRDLINTRTPEAISNDATTQPA